MSMGDLHMETVERLYTRFVAAGLLASLLCSCAGIEISYRYPGPGSVSVPVAWPVHGEAGIASYYADKYQGRLTANGERFNMYDLTAAHKTLPFDSIVRVVNRGNGRSVVVRINDRGPFIKGRIIDLSYAAFGRIASHHDGLADVVIEVLN